MNGIVKCFQFLTSVIVVIILFSHLDITTFTFLKILAMCLIRFHQLV